MHQRTCAFILLSLLIVGVSSGLGPTTVQVGDYSTGPLHSEQRSNHTSNLSWGPNSGLNVFVVPGGFIVLSVNITNGASISDQVDFSIAGQSGWGCYWNGTSTSCDQPQSIDMAPGYLAWPKFDIHVPAVANGLPSAFVKHPFTMTATSGIDAVEVNYSFTLEVDEWHAASIDSGATNLTMNPGLKERTPIKVRNLGNAPSSLAARVVALGVDGEPIQGHEPDLSYQLDGWLVGIFNVYLLNGQGGQGLDPDGVATIDLEIQPPSQTSGTMRIGVIIWSWGNPYDSVMVEVNATIGWVRGGSLSVEDGCGEDILPDLFCHATLSVTNTGNFEDTYEFEVETPEWMRADLSRSQIIVSKGDDIEAANLMLRVQGMVPAFTHGDAVINLRLASGEIIDSHTIDIRVGPVVDWDLNTVESSTDSRDNVSVAFTLRNLGNGDDGLQVGLHVDMNVEHGLIPPEGAVHGATDGIPRYFEIDNIPPGVNFTFRAWMHIPRGLEANGTVTMTVEMMSTLQPEIIFVNETKAPYLAEAYRPENILEPTAWDKLEAQLAATWNEFNGLCLTMIVGVVGGLALYQALLYRKRRDEEWEAKLKAQQPADPEQLGDWMSRFTQGAIAVPGMVAGTVIEAPKVAAKVFTDLFAAKSTTRRPEKEPPDPTLLDAANVVLTHHEKEKELDRLDDLATGIIDMKEPHPANIDLPDPKPEGGRTVRKPKKKPQSQGSQASTTTEDDEDEDFDLDL